MAAAEAIELHHVTKEYAIAGLPQRVLHSVNLTIKPGEFMSVVGPSGSGKTTLAHIIGGLTKPTTGDVLIGGQNLRTLGDRKLSRFRNQRIGFVFQNFSLLPRYTALENVAVPLQLAKVPQAERLAAAEEALKAVGMGQRLRAWAHQLSGGERQRVAIARAIITKPQCIIADEPTGSLDSHQGDEIADLLQSLQRLHGSTLIMVTHNPQLAVRAERALHLLDGVVKEQL